MAAINPQKYNQYQNGRVVGLCGEYDRFKLSQDDTNRNNTYKCEVIKGIALSNPLNQSFFSRKNMDVIQEALKREVYRLSNGKYMIDNQSETELVIIMRGMYFQYSRNLLTAVQPQVNELNDKVIKYCVPQIVSGIVQHLGYLDSVQTMPEVIDHPVNMSNKGTRTLPSITTTF